MAVTTDYINGFDYENGVLQTFPHAEGYVKTQFNYLGTTQIINYVYHYIYKDHLGNNHLVYADLNKDGTINPANEIIEENNYYPFGLKHKGYNELPGNGYKYKFGGKELNSELGLDLYDFGARNYDPALGRWLNVDPLAGKYPGWTPYHYVHNNPINMIDPTGMEGEGWIESYTKDGQAMLTYDKEIDTKKQAIKKGYKNVSSVSESLYYEGRNNTESYNLNKDGTVQNNTTESVMDVGFSPTRTGDGTYIAENNGFKSTDSALQTGGDAIQVLGLGLTASVVGAEVGAPLVTAGTILSVVGTAIEVGYSFSNKNYLQGTTKALISIMFNVTGGLGVKATQKVAGGAESQFVKQGLNNTSEAVIQGTNMVMEKTLGKGIKDKVNSKK